MAGRRGGSTFMKVEAIAVDLRRRRMFEAADLGVRLVQADARSVWWTIAPVWAAMTAFCALTATLWAPAPWLALFWLKPWFDRSILFVLARSAFREPTRPADLLAAGRSVWWRDVVSTLTIRRLSPWRAYVQPARQLEGQRGPAQRARLHQLLNNHQGTALAVQGAFATAESCISVGLAVLPAFFLSGVDDGSSWFDDLFQVFGGDDADDVGTGWLAFACYAGTVLFLEPFFVGAGFGMYLNRRVELEAWDIEQEFRAAFAPAPPAPPSAMAAA